MKSRLLICRIRYIAIGVGLSALALAPTVASADDVTVSGCPQAGVEAGCITITAGTGGTVYNITAAMPRPQIGLGGTVSGTLNIGVASFCQQGIVLSPATWKPDPSIKCMLPPSLD
jgi:hypothetical protein